MYNVGIIEAANYMDDSVYFADVGEKLVSESLALGSSLYQTGNVHKFDDSRGNLGRIIERCQLLESLVGNGNDAHIRVDGAEGIVGGLGAGLCQRVE